MKDKVALTDIDIPFCYIVYLYNDYDESKVSAPIFLKPVFGGFSLALSRYYFNSRASG